MENVVAYRKGEISRDAVVTSVKFKTVVREYNYWVANRPEDFQLNAYTIRH